jgi:protein-tyrosine-phosphatase
MLHILLICTGNTCRSPMAGALLEDRILREGMKDKVVVSSAGLAALNGEPASGGASSAMERRGLTLDRHHASRLSLAMLQEADLILTMSPTHEQAILALAPLLDGKVYTLGEYAGENAEIADPYGGNHAIYEACTVQLEKILAKVWGKIVTLAGKSS